MTTIGTFEKRDNEFYGAITTLHVDTATSIIPIKKTNAKAPSFRVYANNAEIGAAWSKTSKEGQPYLAIKLDDPSFVVPVHCALVKGKEGEYNLVWNRS
jgi:uncharacterized protein (DUF736 family)